jgi:hypothetical protein
MKATGKILFLILFLSNPVFSQFIALQKDDKVEVRDKELKYISSWYL